MNDPPDKTTRQHIFLEAFIPRDGPKEYTYAIRRYATWLIDWIGDDEEREWHSPNLALYRDEFLKDDRSNQGMVAAHLSLIRRRYREVLDEPVLFTLLVRFVSKQSNQDLVELNIRRAIESPDARLKPTRELTTAKRIIPYEVMQLFADKHSSFNLVPVDLKGLRDWAIIKLMLSTGVRETELIRLKVSDLKHFAFGKSALKITQTRNNKVRFTPYLFLDREEQSKALTAGFYVPWIIRKWVKEANLSKNDFIGKSLSKGGRIREGGMSLRSVKNILASHPVQLESGDTLTVNSTSIRAYYSIEMSFRRHQVEEIALYLGASSKQVQVYIDSIQS